MLSRKNVTTEIERIVKVRRFNRFARRLKLVWAIVALSSTLAACTHHTNQPAVERHITGEIKGHSDGRDEKIWFVKAVNDQIDLVPVLRNLGDGDRIAEAVKQLLQGPSDLESGEGLSTEIPKGTTLLGVTRADGDVELNLSKDFASAGGGASLQTRIEQLAKTLSTVAGNQKVYLDIEGERLSATSGDGLEIKQPINDVTD